MKWLPIAICLGAAGQSFAAEPFARVEIEDKGPVVPGQQFRLDVTVFAPDFFTSPPQFPLFDLPDAVVTLPDERAQNSSETENGTQYSGIRRVYAIVPERSGTFTLPSVSIELGYSVDGKPVRGQATLPAFEFTVDEGRASSPNTLAFAASQLTLSENFDSNPASLKVGDALVRTIVVFAENTQAMMIPSIDVGAAIGMKQYASTSKIEDNISVDRRLGSRRIQTVTYTAEVAGSFVIPGVSYAWYDTDVHGQSTSTLPSTKVTAVAVSSPTERIAPTLRGDVKPRPILRRHLLVSAIVVLILLSFGWLTWRLRHWLSVKSKNLINAYRNSDRRALHVLQMTIRSEKPKDIEAALRQWSRRKGCRSLPDWTAGNLELRNQVESLQGLLYREAVDVGFDREALMKAVLASVRQAASRCPVRSYLPTLNPRS